MKIGYARISRPDQSLDSQIDALKEAGCVKIFSEQVSGRRANMPEFEACMSFLREGDTLVVRHIDRLNRGTLSLLKLYEELNARKIFLKATAQPIDTSDPTLGKLMLHILSIFAETEHDLIKERSRQGLEAARARGRIGGRIPKLDASQRAHVIDCYNSRKYTLKRISQMFNVGVTTVLRITYKDRHEQKIHRQPIISHKSA